MVKKSFRKISRHTSVKIAPEGLSKVKKSSRKEKSVKKVAVMFRKRVKNAARSFKKSCLDKIKKVEMKQQIRQMKMKFRGQKSRCVVFREERQKLSGKMGQTKPRPLQWSSAPGQTTASSRLRQEAAEMESCDDSAFCRYHRGRSAPLGRERWEFGAVGVETLREKELCHEKCPAYGGSFVQNEKKMRGDVGDKKRSLENWEPEMKAFILKAKKSNCGERKEEMNIPPRDENKMAEGKENKPDDATESELPEDSLVAEEDGDDDDKERGGDEERGDVVMRGAGDQLDGRKTTGQGWKTADDT